MERHTVGREVLSVALLTVASLGGVAAGSEGARVQLVTEQQVLPPAVIREDEIEMATDGRLKGQPIPGALLNRKMRRGNLTDEDRSYVTGL